MPSQGAEESASRNHPVTAPAVIVSGTSPAGAPAPKPGMDLAQISASGPALFEHPAMTGLGVLLWEGLTKRRLADTL